jgi:hypothetical protein
MGILRSVDSLAREYTEEAIDTTLEVMRDQGVDPGTRLKAAQTILDRGHGKPLNAVIALPVNRQHAAALAAMTDEELETIIQSTPLPRLQPARAPVVEAPVVKATAVEHHQAPLTFDHDPLLL